jgi:hypothetical protein
MKRQLIALTLILSAGANFAESHEGSGMAPPVAAFDAVLLKKREEIEELKRQIKIAQVNQARGGKLAFHGLELDLAAGIFGAFSALDFTVIAATDRFIMGNKAVVNYKKIGASSLVVVGGLVVGYVLLKAGAKVIVIEKDKISYLNKCIDAKETEIEKQITAGKMIEE